MTLTMQAQAQQTIAENVHKYAHMLCDALGQSAPKNYHYEVTSTGRKYHKIHMFINNRLDSIHCFIDKNTGEVYKPASTKAPAKGVRYDLRLIKDREYLLENADWSGSYLYAR